VQRRPPALAARVLQLVESALDSPTAPAKLRAVPILKSAQTLIEASVLHRLLDIVPSLDQRSALNMAAWAHQNRKSLFSSLPAGTYETVSAQLHAASKASEADLAAHEVDAHAARETMARLMGPTRARVRTLFRQAVFIRTPEVTHALFRCWKTLSGDDDIHCHTLLLHEAQFLMGTTTAPLISARQLIQEAWADLKVSLKSPNANLAAAMELHEALITFIAAIPDFGASPEWAMNTLAEMASDPLSQRLRIVNPNAVAWPFWLRARMSLISQSGDECLALLSKCAGLDGVVADLRFDALFAPGIRQLVSIWDANYSRALRAFMIWQSLPRGGIGEPLPIDLVEPLVSSLHKAIVNRASTGVDSQQAMAALMNQLRRADEAVALRHLDAILGSKEIQQDHPLLGVALCVQWAEYSARWKDMALVQQLVAKALAHLPADPQQALEARELLEPFLQPAQV